HGHHGQQQCAKHEGADQRWADPLVHTHGLPPRVRKLRRAGSPVRANSSFGGPLAVIARLWTSRYMLLVPMLKMRARSWLTTTAVIPRLSRRLLISWSSLLALIGSSPADGSSKNRMLG